MLAEYLLGNPHRRGHRRRRHNPAGLSVRTLTNPMPLLTDAASGIGGVVGPIIVGNLALSYLGPSVPMLTQPGIVGSAIRAALRVGAAMVLDPVVSRIPMLDKTAYRVGAAIGIGGSFLMDLLGRPLIIGPGDQSLSVQYLFGGFSGAPLAGQGAYFARGVRGTGAYFARGVRGTGALVPTPHMRGVGTLSPKGADLFTPY